MSHGQNGRRLVIGRRSVSAGLAASLATLLSACSGGSYLPSISSPQPAQEPQQPPQPQQGAIGGGEVRTALILPMSGSGNAGPVAQSMRNAAELALSEFNAPNIQLLVKDDGGNAMGAQSAAQTALGEGAEIVLGPLFAPTVAPAGQVARQRNIPVIAFSTDSSVAARGVYLLSFLPEGDVNRIISYAASRGKRSFAAIIPDNAYGNVVEAAFQQAVAQHSGRVVTLERVGTDPSQIQEAVRRIARGLPQADALFLPGDAGFVPQVGRALATSGVDLKRIQLLGTGLWDDPQLSREASLHGGWFPAPESAGFRGFAARYRARFKEDPLRAATLAYDAVSLVAALVKTQGAQRFSEQVLTNPSGFSGIDGIFRFRSDGASERGLAVMRITASSPQVVNPAPKAFRDSAT